jgi:3D (Asp-Asp-Asp) domain-containing protein
MRDRWIKGLAAAMMAALLTGPLAAQTSPNVKTELRVDFETRVETKPIPFRITYEVSRTVSAGRIQTQSEGRSGQEIDTYRVTLKDGKPVSKTLVSSQKVAPEDQVILIGKAGATTSRHMYYRGRVLNMNATAYYNYTGHRTASGRPAIYGAVAVDPRFIAMGTVLYIEGYGLAIAADTGGAIKGNRIDLCYATRGEAIRFGRRTVKVHLLSEK